MHILVINSGSSSIKYQLIRMTDEAVLARGQVERIGEDASLSSHRVLGDAAEVHEERDEGRVPDHDDGFRSIMDHLSAHDLLDDLAGVGHRVVHGGERYDGPTVVDDAVLGDIRDLTPLAPLHNPPNARGIEVARSLRADVPHVAVFDTSFHRTLPPRAYRYAVPTSWYTDHGVRRYGFHGTSHAYVARAACDWLPSDPATTNLVTAHLGNGASMAAVAGGACIDTSMGLSPLEGLVMGTRSGDIDPAVVFHLVREAGMSVAEVERGLLEHSGLKGLCGVNDVREIERRAADGDADAELALDVFAHRFRSYVGAYTAVLGRVDVLVFTAGIGEHSATVRARSCAGLAHLGIVLDDDRNADPGADIARISTDDSPVAVLVVPTNEEFEIARQTQTAITAA